MRFSKPWRCRETSCGGNIFPTHHTDPAAATPPTWPPSNFHVFGILKKHLLGQGFPSADAEVQKRLWEQDVSFENLNVLYKKCSNKIQDYVEK
jgi:hypothetical protein